MCLPSDQGQNPTRILPPVGSGGAEGALGGVRWGGGGFRRVLIPVIYCNHPLFSDLLREAEKEFGFEHPGGITIPCRLTEFERVKTRIASGSGQRGRTRRLGWPLQHY
ncbi:Auxin-induced protein X10A [Glycine soja]|uniref:Auxin-induced protein X10A n=1 Tax=Glycine soja TaxID=3848 RepID=A0A0B2RTM0_GLYSO|nr:Auxin-induced protein X10A [Glycine soja]